MNYGGHGLPIATIMARIEDNIVVETIIIEFDYYAENIDKYPGEWIDTRIDKETFMPCAIGWTWDGNEFIAPVIEDIEL